MARFRLVRTGWAGIGRAGTGLVWELLFLKTFRDGPGSVRSVWVRRDMVRPGEARCGLGVFPLPPLDLYGLVRNGSVRCGTVRLGWVGVFLFLFKLFWCGWDGHGTVRHGTGAAGFGLGILLFAKAFMEWRGWERRGPVRTGMVWDFLFLLIFEDTVGQGVVRCAVARCGWVRCG